MFGFVFDLLLVLVFLIVGIYCGWMLLPWDLLLSRIILDIHVCFMLISWLVQFMSPFIAAAAIENVFLLRFVYADFPHCG